MISVDINNMLYFHFHECDASCFYVQFLEGQSIKFSWVPVFGRYLTSLCLVCMCWFLSSIELDSLLLSYTFLLYFALPKGSSLWKIFLHFSWRPKFMTQIGCLLVIVCCGKVWMQGVSTSSWPISIMLATNPANPQRHKTRTLTLHSL